MRNLDDFYYLTEHINKLIDDKLQDTRSQIVKVKKTDGIFCDCELVKSQDDVKEFKNVPIVQSGRFHYSVKEDDFGLMLNIGQIPAEFFSLGTIKGAIMNLPFYLFLPLQTQIDGQTNQLKKDNVIIEDSEKTVSMKFDQDAGLTLESQKAISMKDAEGLTIESQKAISMKDAEGLTIESGKAISIKAGGGQKIDLNESKLGATLQKLSTDLQTLQQMLLTAPIAGNGAPAAISFTPSSASDLASIAQKLN